MIPVLSMLSLVLSVASDGEGEESWEDRFARCDAERAKYEIEPLTPAERMTWMIGQAPPIPRYMLEVKYDRTLIDKAWVIRVFKATPRKKDGVLIWKLLHVENLTKRGNVFWFKTLGRKDAEKAISEMSERIRVPMALQVCTNDNIRYTFYRFPWDPPHTHTHLAAKMRRP